MVPYRAFRGVDHKRSGMHTLSGDKLTSTAIDRVRTARRERFVEEPGRPGGVGAATHPTTSGNT